MVSKFITDLPVKSFPGGNDIVLIQDVDGKSTSVVTLSNLRDYMFNYQVPELSASSFSALTASFTVLDIKQYELSGFVSTGNVYMSGDLMVAKLIKTGENGNSSNWYGTFVLVNSNSGRWESNWTTVNSNSGRWESNWTTFNSNSGEYSSARSTVNNLSSRWESNWTTVNSNSADWDLCWNYVNSLPSTLTTTVCAMSGDGVTPFSLSFSNGLLTGITWL
jgi:hypothetical protein